MFSLRQSRYLGPAAHESVDMLVGLVLVDGDKLLGLVVRQRPEHESIENAENRGIGPDPKRQNQNGHDSETGIPTQHSKTILDILPQ